jgi:polyisoprenoid-binding protein YceI
MKSQLKFLSIALIISVFAACSSGGSKTEATDAKQVKQSSFDEVYYADTKESIIKWEGYKPTGTHNGTISVSSGKLEVKDGTLTGGEFTIDMNSITVLDIKDAESNAKLTGHLKSADFFEVESFPTAKFVITNVKTIDGGSIDKSKEKGDIVPTHALTGNLTMKGITKSITINAMVDLNQNMVKAKTNQFFLDRAEWNVQYGSKSFFNDLKDNFINDEMGLIIEITAPSSEDISSK